MLRIPNSVARIFNPAGCAPVVLVCEHASNAIPESLYGLGIDASVQNSHAAWDIGALDLARALGQELDAPLVWCTVSRLAYDCNRPLEARDAIAAKSEQYSIPGNRALSADQRQERFNAIHNPFHDAVASAIETQKQKTGEPLTLIAVHSFTPVFHGEVRELEIGFIYDTDAKPAEAVLQREKEKNRYYCALNEPYNAADGVTYCLRKHTGTADIGGVMLEVRNDLIDTIDKASSMALHLADTLRHAICTTQSVGKSA